MKSTILLLLFIAINPGAAEEPAISHSFLTLGGKTAIISEDGRALWEYKGGTRDGFVLPGGNVLLTWKDRVEEVTRDHKVVFAYDLSTENKELGTAQRLDNGNTLVSLTLVSLTHGNKVAEFNPAGRIVWKVTNDDVGGLFQDPCGSQRLANGNTVIGSHGARKGVFLVEVTPGKKIVWTSDHPLATSVHHFQILTTNGKPEPGMPLK